MIKQSNIEMENSFIGSRELSLCDSAHSSIGTIIRSFTSVRNMQTNSFNAEIYEIFVSYCLRHFHNRNGTYYGYIVGYSYDKNVKLHNFRSAR